MQLITAPSLLDAITNPGALQAITEPTAKTRLPIYSASQIETYKDCPRKWAWDKIDRIPRGSTAAAQLGDRVHKQLERHLLGQGFDFAADHVAADLASLAVPYLPPPKTDDNLEIERSFTRVLGPSSLYQYTGRIDARQILDEITIYDHKTTGNIQYVKTAEVLAADIQANLYAYESLDEYPVPHVNAQWTYIPTRGKREVIPVTLTLSRPQVEDFFLGTIDRLANEINTARQGATTAKDLPFNSSACNSYGGCPYQSNCNLSPHEALKAMSNTPFVPAAPGTSLLEQMQRGLTPPMGAPAAPLAPPAPPPAAPAAHEDMYNLWPKDARGAPTVDNMGRPLPPALIDRMATTGHIPTPGQHNSYTPIRPLTQIVASYFAHYAEKGYTEAAPPAPVAPPPPVAPPTQGWAPQGMQAPPAAPAATFAPPPAFTPPTMAAPAINPPESALPHAAPMGMAAPPPAAPAAPDGAKKRTRRTKAEMEAARAAATPAGAQPSLPATANTGERSPIEILCVGCRPSGGAFKVIDLARDILPIVTEQIKRDLNVDDYAAMDFGKGSAALALYGERAVLAACESIDDDVCLVVDRGTREAMVILSKLYPLANTVVHGV